jgi:TfoX/Sxy family transcriptional regulator of competence genes
MKTILSNGTYLRVSDEVADREVAFGRAKFTPKSEWKKNVRDIKVEAVVVTEEKGEKTKSKKAEKARKLKAKQRQ